MRKLRHGREVTHLGIWQSSDQGPGLLTQIQELPLRTLSQAGHASGQDYKARMTGRAQPQPELLCCPSSITLAGLVCCLTLFLRIPGHPWVSPSVTTDRSVSGQKAGVRQKCHIQADFSLQHQSP